jgi:DNA-binding protein WhiA
MFLCTGSVNDPRKGYHLEFCVRAQSQAEQLTEVLRSLGLEARTVRRGRSLVVYIKEASDIVDLLNLMGAPVSMMEMENQRILKGLRGDVNRRVNCETANIGKTVKSAGRQMEDIRYLRENGILQTLPAPLREAADLRTEHSGASLTELGELAKPPVGRSGMNHRLRKLSALAQKAREEKNPS